MEEKEREELCRQLGITDESLGFLALLILSVVLSWKGTAIQREGLCRILEGKSEEIPSVFPIRLTASALVVVALTFFFGLALDTWEESRCGDPQARRSADRNLWASLFVLAAALIRLCDLTESQRGVPAQEEQEEELQPE